MVAPVLPYLTDSVEHLDSLGRIAKRGHRRHRVRFASAWKTRGWYLSWLAWSSPSWCRLPAASAVRQWRVPAQDIPGRAAPSGGSRYWLPMVSSVDRRTETHQLQSVSAVEAQPTLF